MSDISIKDVAAAAGVSIGTVSNVLNRPDVVRDSTRLRVEAAIENLGFVPNGSARQLKAGRSRMLGYLMLDAGNPFFIDVAKGVEQVAETAGLSLFLCDSGQDRKRERRYLRDLAELRVSGVLLTTVDPTQVRVEQLRSRDIPIVMVDQVERGRDPQWCAAGVDDVVGGRLAVDHLIERGHRRIAFVGGPAHIPQVADRWAGASLAIDAAGLDADSLQRFDTAALTVAEGRSIGDRLLAVPAGRRPTAAFCANDLLAVGLLQLLTQRGVDVPQEMAIIGYDDIDYAASAAVPLSSIAQPREEIGRAAARLLLAEAANPDHRHESVILLPTLVPRASTGG